MRWDAGTRWRLAARRCVWPISMRRDRDRTHVQAFVEHITNRGNELFTGNVLRYIAGGPGIHDGRNDVAIHVHREHDDLRRHARRLQALDRFKTAESRHGDVGNDDVRLKVAGYGHETWPVADGGHDIAAIPKQVAKAIDHDLVVVGEQHARQTHA